MKPFLFSILLILVFVSSVYSADNDIQNKWEIFYTRYYIHKPEGMRYWKTDAFRDLVAIGDRILPFLESRYVDSKDYLLRRMVLHLIGETGKDDLKVWNVYQKYPKLTGCKSLFMDNFVIYYLRNSKNREYITYCKKILKQDDRELHDAVLDTLSWQGRDITTTELLEYYRTKNNPHTFIAIGCLGDASVKNVLWNYTHSEDREESEKALIALGMLRDSEALRRIIKKTDWLDENWLYANAIIEQARTKEVIDILCSGALNDPEWCWLAILERVSGRCNYLETYQGQLSQLICTFQQDPDLAKEEYRKILGWWTEHRNTWIEPNKRMVLVDNSVFWGDNPNDVEWFNVYAEWIDVYNS